MGKRLHLEDRGNQEQVGRPPPGTEVKIAVDLSRSKRAAAAWYQKSLAIKEKLGDEHDAAITYHQLGIVAQEQRDFAAAAAWYQKALAIFEKLGDEYGAASTNGQLGILAGLRERYAEAGQWLIKCIGAFAHQNDPAGVEKAAGQFALFHDRAPAAEQARLKAMWEAAGLGPLSKRS